MGFTAVFSLVVLCTCVDGSKLISQQESGSPSHKKKGLEDVAKHALDRGDVDKRIADATKAVGQTTKVRDEKKSKHEQSIQNEQDAFKKESQAEEVETGARQKKEEKQAAKSAAQKKVEILEGQHAAILDVEAATEGVATAETNLGKAKSARTKHLADVKKAGDVVTLAETRVQNAEAAENTASVAATKAELDLQTAKHTLEAVNAMCNAAQSPPLDQFKHFYCAPVVPAQQAKKKAEEEKKEADDALEAAQKEEEDAVAALADAKQKKIDLDMLTGDFQAAVDDAETKRAVALIALDRAMENAHKHFTSQQAIDEAKSENLQERLRQAKKERDAAVAAFNQAKAKYAKAKKDLEEAEQDSKEATQAKLTAKHELEQAQLRLDMAESDLRSAQSDLENARNDAKENLQKAQNMDKQAQAALTQATQALDSHNQELSAAVDAFEDAHKKLTDAEAHHASKVACQQGSKAALDEATAFRNQAEYWSSHTELLEKEHYWDAEFGPIHQSADKIYSEKSGDYDDAKTKNDKHNEEVAKALKAVQAAQDVKDEASEAQSNLEARTPLLQAAKTTAEGKKNDAAYRLQIAKAIHEVWHK